jgi:hypothetical protein
MKRLLAAVNWTYREVRDRIEGRGPFSPKAEKGENNGNEKLAIEGEV